MSREIRFVLRSVAGAIVITALLGTIIAPLTHGVDLNTVADFIGSMAFYGALLTIPTLIGVIGFGLYRWLTGRSKPDWRELTPIGLMLAVAIIAALGTSGVFGPLG